MLPINADHAEGIRQYPELSRHDLFDRLLVSQAGYEGLVLVTGDQVLLGLGHDFILDATR
jgi:PIN domain nuclease of toxin-antitoxin system